MTKFNTFKVDLLDMVADKKREVYGSIKAWRNPTHSEVRFGYGAINWGEFERWEWEKPDGNLKKWAMFDGLRYNR